MRWKCLSARMRGKCTSLTATVSGRVLNFLMWMCDVSLATRCVAMILLAWIFVLQGGPALVTGVSLSIDLWYQRLYVYAFELISLYIYIVLLRCVSSCAHDNKQTYRMLDWTTGFFLCGTPESDRSMFAGGVWADQCWDHRTQLTMPCRAITWPPWHVFMWRLDALHSIRSFGLRNANKQ